MAEMRTAVAMSGGVDSSVAAARLVQEGQDVFGIMLRLWSSGPQQPNRCCSPADMDRARQVADQLDIPFYVLDVQDLFKAQIVDFFLDGYAKGLTPNPCIECNRTIRWEHLLNHALGLGATHLATGHYARVRHNGEYILERAIDRSKDQSYVLSVLGQGQLKHALFPLGDWTKDRVREIARELDLPVASRPESQDLCFVGRQDYREFLLDQGHEMPRGPIQTSQGESLGQHNGLAGYTIGQRRGIGVAADEPLYVIEKRPATNTLVVGPRDQLGRSKFRIDRVNWTSSRTPDGPLDATVQVRYRAPEVRAVCSPAGDGQWQIELEEPLPDITPGQSAVLYAAERVLGSGIIQP